MKVAVITPYADEPIDVLWRCHQSVLRQTHPCGHFLVADGASRPALSDWNAQHIQLPARHHDGGCTPRALGAIAALNQGFDVVCFLDADNYYAEDHVEACVSAVVESEASVVFAQRQIVLPDGQLCPYEDLDVLERRHADTSCHVYTRAAAALFPLWAQLGPRLWPACDRILFSVVRSRGLSVAWLDSRTVYYTSRWGLHFKAMGLAPPPDEHRLDWDAVHRAWSDGELTNRLGFDCGWDPFSGNEHAEASEREASGVFYSRLGLIEAFHRGEALSKAYSA